MNITYINKQRCSLACQRVDELRARARARGLPLSPWSLKYGKARAVDWKDRALDGPLLLRFWRERY